MQWQTNKTNAFKFKKKKERNEIKKTYITTRKGEKTKYKICEQKSKYWNCSGKCNECTENPKTNCLAMYTIHK